MEKMTEKTFNETLRYSIIAIMLLSFLAVWLFFGFRWAVVVSIFFVIYNIFAATQLYLKEKKNDPSL